MRVEGLQDSGPLEARLEAPAAELGERADLALTLSGLYPVMLMSKIWQEAAGSFHSPCF